MSATESDMDAALVMIQSAYRTELDYLQLEAYREGLSGLSGQVLKKAASMCIREEKRFPTVATLREYAAAACRALPARDDLLLPPWNPQQAASDRVTQEGLKLIRECKERIFAKWAAAMPKATVQREPGEEG